MANTYTQIHIHAVFAVKYRMALINPEWKEQLCKYITGILQNNGHKMLAINGVQDHIHVFFGLNTDQSIAMLMQDIKSNSSGWINKSGFLQTRFQWQSGYGGFSYSHSQIDRVVKYILHQEIHHKRQSFRDEYLKILKQFGVEYDEKYLFEFF
jgi:putative transposase